ncbi:hypothetical protein MAUB1S_04263 [Mycolicibacterium aubagnense]
MVATMTPKATVQPGDDGTVDIGDTTGVDL